VKHYAYHSPIGELTISGTSETLCGLWLPGRAPSDACDFDQPSGALAEMIRWLDCYFAKGKLPPLPQMSPEGTEFRRAVWELLLEIPYGETTTYAAIARKIAAQRGITTMSAQAVGGAVGANPISILIPCHRVVGSDSSLTGYAGGIDRKKFLLELEAE